MTTQELARKLIDEGWIDELMTTEELVTGDLNQWLEDTELVRKPYDEFFDKTRP